MINRHLFIWREAGGAYDGPFKISSEREFDHLLRKNKPSIWYDDIMYSLDEMFGYIPNMLIIHHYDGSYDLLSNKVEHFLIFKTQDDLLMAKLLLE